LVDRSANRSGRRRTSALLGYASSFSRRSGTTSSGCVAAEHRLREDEVAVDVDVEDPAHSRYDLDRAHGVLPLLEDARRQTGGVRECPSGNAVLDANVMALGHRLILSAEKGCGPPKRAAAEAQRTTDTQSPS
jgi:hypothetical protein